MQGLKKYILVRFLLIIPTVFILLTVIFFILRVLPGDPITAMVGQKAPPEMIAKLRAEAGLDKPLYVQYFSYLFDVIRGNLGHSLIWGKRPVIKEIMDRFPATLELSIYAFLFSVFVGIFTGALAGFNKGTKLDLTLRFYGIFTYTLFIPWIGMMLQMIFGVWLKILPIGGRITPGLEPPHITGLYTVDSLLTFHFASFEDAVLHLILPVFTLGLVLSGAYTRLVRNNLIEILSQDFILAYKARGISRGRIIYHAIKNAFIPIITLMGLQFAILLAGAVLTETTFSWPGIGSFLLERIEYRDYPCVQGVIVFYALFVALISLIVDIIYALVDPRVKY